MIAGLILGLLFLSLGASGWVSAIVERIPEPVTRGIQLGLALLLIRSGFQYALPDPYLAVIGVALILFFTLAHRFSRLPDLSAIAVLVAGVSLGIILHGLPAWGLPALYRYGASTSVANLIAGAVLIVIAVFSADHGIVTLFPAGLLGSLLFFVAVDLARSGLKTISFPSTLVTGIVSVATSMTIGFLAGFIVWLLQRSYSRR